MSVEDGEGRSAAAGRPSSQGGPAGEADPAWAPLDAALSAFLDGDEGAELVMRTDVGGAEEVPVALFFREPAAMGPVESEALALARGHVLDLGAGPGAHAVPLVRRGLTVTAVEVLPRAVEVLRTRGLADARVGGLDAVAPEERFDTVLVLMNGLGLAGALEGLGPFLRRLAGLLTEAGQILADSTDPRDWDDPDDGRYPGEVHMQLGFGARWGPPFPFLFVDADTLEREAAAFGLAVAVVAREDDGRYLARITPARRPPAP